jgi:hypothetical protein
MSQQVDEDDRHGRGFVDEESEHNSTCDHIQEEDQAKLHKDEKEMSEGFQTDQDQVCCRNKDKNAFSYEELDSNSFIHDSTFSSSFQENDFQDDFGNIDNVEDSLIEQHDDEIVDLDLCEDQQLIEDHIQSSFVGLEHGHLAIVKFLKEDPYQSYNQLDALKYDELHVTQNPFQEELQDDCEDGNNSNVIEIVSDLITVVNPYEDQAVNIQSLLPEHHETKILKVKVHNFFL